MATDRMDTMQVDLSRISYLSRSCRLTSLSKRAPISRILSRNRDPNIKDKVHPTYLDPIKECCSKSLKRDS